MRKDCHCEWAIASEAIPNIIYPYSIVPKKTSRVHCQFGKFYSHWGDCRVFKKRKLVVHPDASGQWQFCSDFSVPCVVIFPGEQLIGYFQFWTQIFNPFRVDVFLYSFTRRCTSSYWYFSPLGKSNICIFLNWGTQQDNKPFIIRCSIFIIRFFFKNKT